VTRHRKARQVTIEKLTHDCLDVRFLRRKGFFADGGVTVGATLKWPSIARNQVIVPKRIRRHEDAFRREGIFLADRAHGHRAVRFDGGAEIGLDKLAAEMKAGRTDGFDTGLALAPYSSTQPQQAIFSARIVGELEQRR
jgi:hypothetical protein